MIFSQGLIISLGFTLLIAVALFFYVRQRTNAVEDKINTLIQFVQTETLKLQQPRVNEEMSVYQAQPTTVTQNQQHVDLIDVSDDESTSDESDVDSSSEDDDSSDDESTLGSVASVEEQDQNETTRTVSMQPIEDDEQNNEDVIHLRVIKPEEESETQLVTGDEHISNNLEEELDALTLSDLSDGEDQDAEGEDENDNQQVDESGSPIVNYKKMLVSQLRMIAEQKGLVEDGRKFKKTELVALLEKQ